MDFMNFMNQFNSCDLGSTFSNDNLGKGKGDNLLPLLLLMLQGNNNFQGGMLTCYPNNQFSQPFTIPNSDFGSNVKYRRKRVRQAYMEVPVSIYQTAQPYVQPTTFNVMPNNTQQPKGGDLISTILLLSLLNNRHCRPDHCTGSAEI